MSPSLTALSLLMYVYTGVCMGTYEAERTTLNISPSSYFVGRTAELA